MDGDKQMKRKSKYQKKQRILTMYLCVLITSLFVFFGIIMSITVGNDEGWKTFLGISGFQLLLVNLVVFHIYTCYSEELYNGICQKKIIQRQKIELIHYEKLMQSNQKRDEFVHNSTHFIRIIGKLASVNDTNTILKIINGMQNEIETQEMITYSNNHLLNVVLSEKKNEAEKNNVHFDAFVEAGSDLKMLSDMDLIAMLGNLLDNAIRAASESNNKNWVKVRIFMQHIGGFCIVKMNNGCSGKVKMDGERFLSTKKEDGIHGIGLKSVENIAEKYGGCLNYGLKEDVFETILLLATN